MKADMFSSNVNGARARSVSSVFVNLEKLVCERAPRSGQAMLGVRWSFALPRPALRSELVEYSFPFGRVPFTETLATRAGLHLVAHGSDEADLLPRHLEGGEAAIVVVDSFFLPYRPAFGRVHSHRTIIVRPGQHRGDVQVEDGWPPRYKGRLSLSDLERARHSPVPLDKKLEPIFAGLAIGGEWLSVEIAQRPISDVAEWGAQLLQALHREATVPASDERGAYGIAAMRLLRQELAEKLVPENETRFDFTREAALLLRAELSSRVFLCALLRAASGWLADERLRQEAEIYYAGLRHLEMARDVLTKSLVHPRMEYSVYIQDWMTLALASEERLAGCLSVYASHVAEDITVEKSQTDSPRRSFNERGESVCQPII